MLVRFRVFLRAVNQFLPCKAQLDRIWQHYLAHRTRGF